MNEFMSYAPNISNKREAAMQRLIDSYSGDFNDDGVALRRLLHGLSTHKCHENSALAAEMFGIPILKMGHPVISNY